MADNLDILAGTDYLTSKANISEDGQYRYRLERSWDDSLPQLCIVMVNPSTADADSDDPTVLQCVAAARKWGYGSISVVNLWAFRSPSPEKLQQLHVAAALGPRNMQVLYDEVTSSNATLLAWGNNGAWMNAGPHFVARLLGYKELSEVNERAPSALHMDSLYCLGMTNAKEPRHPLRAEIPDHPVIFDPVKYLKEWVTLLQQRKQQEALQ